MDFSKKDYQVRPEYPEPTPARFQMAAITGAYGLGTSKKHKYVNAAHFDLISKVVPLREAFRAMRRDKKAREEIAS